MPPIPRYNLLPSRRVGALVLPSLAESAVFAPRPAHGDPAAQELPAPQSDVGGQDPESHEHQQDSLTRDERDRQDDPGDEDEDPCSDAQGAPQRVRWRLMALAKKARVHRTGTLTRLGSEPGRPRTRLAPR